MTRFAEHMVTGGWHRRSSWPRSSSRFLVPVFLQGSGQPRVAARRRSTEKIPSAPKSHRRVQGRPSSVSAKILPETGNAFRNHFFCNLWKRLQSLLTPRVYSRRTFYCWVVCTSYLLPTLCTQVCQYPQCQMRMYLLWWDPETERIVLRNWDLPQRMP